MAEKMTGSICMVTGGNSGLGFETCKALAAMGTNVIMVARNLQKGQHAIEQIKTKITDASVRLMLCDFSAQDNIREFAAEYKTHYDRLDVLVNNAGAMFRKYGETVDGIERTFAINHLGYFLLTHLLLDRLRNANTARIVNVASHAHYDKEIDFDDYNNKNNYRFFEVYGKSKLANIMFTYELASRLQHTGITANALHPGVVATNLVTRKEIGLGRFLVHLALPFLMNQKKGAESQIFLATSSEIEGITGKYWDKKEQKYSSRISQDIKNQKKLWQLSEKLTGIKSDDYFA